MIDDADIGIVNVPVLGSSSWIILISDDWLYKYLKMGVFSWCDYTNTLITPVCILPSRAAQHQYRQDTQFSNMSQCSASEESAF